MFAIVSVIFAFISRVVSIETLKFVAYRAMLLTAFTVILPAVLYKVVGSLFMEMSTYAYSQISSAGMPPLSLQLTGLAGWMATSMNLEASISVVLSAVSLRFVLNLIGK